MTDPLAGLHPVLVVFLYGLVTALATGLGALPFAFVRRVSPRAVALANAIAAGLMLGACFGLAAEGTRYGAWQTIAGANLGVLFILLDVVDLPRRRMLSLMSASAFDIVSSVRIGYSRRVR